MNRSLRGSGIIALLGLAALAAASPPVRTSDGMSTSEGMTTADLALRLAQAAGIGVPAHDSPRAALDSLGKAGIELGSDLEAPVTEKHLVQVSAALGVRASTSRPESAVTPAVSGALIQLLKGALQSAAAASRQSGTDMIHVSCQGRASRAARQGTPASPSNFNATAGPCEEPAS